MERLPGTPLPALSVGNDGLITAANQLAAELFGAAPEALVGRSAEAYLPGLDGVRAGFPSSLQVRSRALRCDGTEIPVSLEIHSTMKSAERLVIVREIDPKPQLMLERLSLRSEDLASLFAGTSDLFVVASLDRVDYVGDIDKLMGYEPGRFPRTLTEVAELVHPEDWQRVTKLVQDFVSSGSRRLDLELRIRAADGTYHHWLERVLATTWFEDGRTFEAIAVISDITQQVRAQSQIRDLRERVHEHDTLHRAILNALDLPLAVLSRKGEILSVSDAWLRLSVEGAKDDFICHGVGTNYFELCERLSSPAGVTACKGIGEVLHRKRKSFEMRYERSVAAKTSWYLMKVTPMGTDRALLIHHDVTSDMEQQLELQRTLEELQQHRDQLRAQGSALRTEIERTKNLPEIAGSSRAIKQALRAVQRVAPSDASVLVLGETGTGKELIARALHSKSRRCGEPLIKIDCGCLPPSIIEAELFGHDKGAFTGAHQSKPGLLEIAHRGTLFLDEIGELPLELQPKLLRVLQEGEVRRIGGRKETKVDVRIIAATNRDLEAEVRQGRFRADLYYRLSVFPITLPPLRDRREDIPELARQLLARSAQRLKRAVDRIPEGVMEALIVYEWPGNIRELENVIERSVILSPGPELQLSEGFTSLVRPAPAPAPIGNGGGRHLSTSLYEMERERIIEALEASNWKVKGTGNAASRLGLNPSTLRSRMKRLGIERPAQ